MPGSAKAFALSLFGAVLLGGAALADPAPPSELPKPAGTDAVTTGSINLDPSAEQRMKDCMAIWEPRTHMTKAEWRRTCKTTLQEFSN